MKRLLVLVGGLLCLALILLPIASAKANKSNVSCQFSYQSTKLIRGQENTINFTMTNLNTDTWVSALALGIPADLGLEIRSPMSGTVGGNYGPWEINYFPPEILLDVPELSQSYHGYTWAVIKPDGNFITGRHVIPPGEADSFSLKIFVPDSVSLGEILIAQGAARAGLFMFSYQIDEAKFQVVEADETSSLSVLPETGSNNNNYYYLIALIIPSLYLGRKFFQLFR